MRAMRMIENLNMWQYPFGRGIKNYLYIVAKKYTVYGISSMYFLLNKILIMKLKIIIGFLLSIAFQVVGTVECSIKNIVFDVGGVILSDGPRYFAQNTSDDANKQVSFKILASDSWKLWFMGHLSKEAMIEQLYQNFDKSIVDAIVAASLSPQRMFLSGTVAVVKTLKALGFKLYILSNFSREAYNIFIVNNDFFKNFDGMLFSFQAGSLKPDAEIYKLLLANYKLEPSETLFIDDTIKNVDSARKIGMYSIVFKQDTIVTELTKLGIFG